jgi:galactose mutarotase-like enzyme
VRVIETTEIEGFAALRLRDGELSATFLPGAGMLGLSLRDGDEELLGARHGLGAYVRDARTMGIPLLHPWANRLSRDRFAVAGTGAEVRIADGAAGLHRDPNGLPIHGLVAALPGWVVEEGPPAAADASDPGAAPAAAFAATLDFAAHPELLASFPFPHTLRIAVTLSERRLRLETTVTATGDVAVPLAYGFHPYLEPRGPREEWLVELPALQRLELDERGIPTGAAHAAPADARPLGDRSLDDAYESVAPGARFAVQAAGRRVELVFERGFTAAQVFAPRSERLICFEPMTAPTDALVSGRGLRLVAPGEQDVTVFAIELPPPA